MAGKRYLPLDVAKASVWIKPKVLERCRNAVVSIGEDDTFTKLLDDALTREVQRLERKHRGGRAFPARKNELTRGARPCPRHT
jgi:hypothetical protein